MGMKAFVNKKQVFLKHYRESLSVSESALAAGMTLAQVYSLKREDEGFAKKWSEVVEANLDKLEDIVRKQPA